MGAWIEIDPGGGDDSGKQSLPSWERGLKYEIAFILVSAPMRRSPRGSVD